VLPFANIGGDPEQEHFVDGVTESLTTDLSRIRCAYVVARNTAFTYKERTGTRSYGANASIAAASYSQRRRRAQAWSRELFGHFTASPS
jgi:TolB-like protein